VTQLLEFKSEQGGAVFVEVDQLPSGPVTRGGRPEEAVVEAGEGLEQVLARLGPVVTAIVRRLREAPDWPDQIEIEFGVRLSADANVIIVRAGGEANFRIALTWSQDQR
jgi:Trypsin-co-occurring domain 1